MVSSIYEIFWTKRSQNNMKAAGEYISQDSVKNAQKVLTDIANAVYKASSNPEFYAPDKYKTNNDGSYRAFEMHRFRVVYRFSKNTIRVLRVRHTSREPKEY